MSSRRKRKRLLKILVFLLVAAAIIWFFIYIYPKSGIRTYKDPNSNNENQIQPVTIDAPMVNVTLPTKIKTISPSSSNYNNVDDTTVQTDSNENTGHENTDKSYEPYVDDSIPYLITILSSDNNLTILLSDKSSSLIDSDSPTKVGYDYNVSNISERIVSAYYFTVDNYSYPIVLLLAGSGNVYYIDTELAYKTGEFSVAGQIANLPSITKVYAVTVDNTYKSAILVDKDDVGYEFSLDMINK